MKTAVDWLEERFEQCIAWYEGQPKAKEYTFTQLSSDFQKAKEMERKQTFEFADEYAEYSYQQSLNNRFPSPKAPELYYNETYGK